LVQQTKENRYNCQGAASIREAEQGS